VATGAVRGGNGHHSWTVQLSIWSPRFHKHPVPSPLYFGKYAKSQSSAGAMDITVGGWYNVWFEATGLGEGMVNCLDEEKCRAITNGSDG